MAGNKMNKQRTENREQNTSRGFTLIEVMIAFVVLLLGMLGVLSMQYYAITGNAASRELRIATNLSQEIIEQMKSTPYNNLAAIITRALPTDATFSAGVTFTRRSWTFADCVGLTLTGDDGTCSAGLVPTCTFDPDGAKVVQVSAVRARTCWSDRNGTNHSVTIDSLRWAE